MAADDFEAPGLSYIDIDRQAMRFMWGMLPRDRFIKYLSGELNIADILEIDFVKAYGFNVEYVNDIEMDARHDAEVSILERTIYLRNSAMCNADKGGRIFFSIGHELGHVALHSNIILSGRVARSKSDQKLPIFNSGEWQAEAFGSAAVMPYLTVFDMIMRVRNLGRNPLYLVPDMLVDKFKVSDSAAYKRVENIQDKIIGRGFGFRLKNEFSDVLGH